MTSRLCGAWCCMRYCRSTGMIIRCMSVHALCRCLCNVGVTLPTDFEQDYSVLLIIPDLFERRYVRELVQILLVQMGFKQICLQQVRRLSPLFALCYPVYKSLGISCGDVWRWRLECMCDR